MRIKVIPPKAPQRKKLRVCAYARVSSDSEEQEDSLTNQTAFYRLHISENPEWEFAGIYSDEGISGFLEKRPGFQKMMADAREHRFDLILVKSISRFARNTQTLLEATRELKALGIGVQFEIQEINTLTAEGELMLTIKGAFFQAESDGASQLLKMAWQRKFQKLEYHPRLAETYGYRPGPSGEFVVVEEHAAVVREIFSLSEKGIWNSQIKEYLNSKDVPSPKGKEWNDSQIARVLHNVIYKGDLILQKYVSNRNRTRRINNGELDQWYIVEHHEPIIDPEQWERVQEVLKKRSEHLAVRLQPPKECRSSHVSYPLSNKLYCPYCGCKLLHKWSMGVRDYWACSTNLKVSSKACKGVWLPCRIADTWGDIREPVTVIEYLDEYGVKQFTALPKEEYEAFSECPYGEEKTG